MLSVSALIQDLEEQRFVGRQRELSVFLEWFARRPAAVLNVSGPAQRQRLLSACLLLVDDAFLRTVLFADAEPGDVWVQPERVQDHPRIHARVACVARPGARACRGGLILVGSHCPLAGSGYDRVTR